jgi:tetratricopeptide (TPR) repeat protein
MVKNANLSLLKPGQDSLDQANRLIGLKKYDEAIDILRDLVEMFPMEADYHSYLGLAMLGKGLSGYAMAEFKVALHYAPGNKISLGKYINGFAESTIEQTLNVENEEEKGLLSKLFSRNK